MKALTALKPFLAVMILCGMSPAFQGESQNRPIVSVIDLAECKRGARVSYSKFGSEKVLVKGRRGSRCVIERTSETEGAYVRSECRIPVSLKSLSLAEKPEAPPAGKSGCGVKYLADVAKYCRVIKTGNILTENN